MSTEAISTILVEDDEITRFGLRKALELIAEIHIIAEAADGKTAVDLCIELHPDLVLMDIGLPCMDGIEATKQIKEILPTKVIIITSHDDDEDVFAGLSAGADAYCLKNISSSLLAHAVHSVMEGAKWLDPGIGKRVLDEALAGRLREHFPKGLASDPFQLSERETNVLGLVVEGLTNQQIGEKLFLSPETVKTHLRHVMEKLRVSDRTQAAVKAVREGIHI